MRELVREHGPYVALLGALTVVMAWLTLPIEITGVVPILFGIDWLLVGVVLFTGLAYKVVQERPDLERSRRENLLFVVFGGGLIALIGTLSNWQLSYLVFIMVTVLTYALFALGLNLEFGYTGIINFGHVAFMGIGAYTTTLLSKAPSPGPFATLVGLLVVGGFAAAAVLTPDRFDHERRLLPGGAFAAGALPAFVLVHGGATSTLGILAILGGVAGLVAAVHTMREHEFEAKWLVLYAVAGVAVAAFGAALAGFINHNPVPIWFAAIIGMLFAAEFGVLLGVPTLRLRADYLAIVTIGAAEILRRAWLNEIWLTDGPRGVVGFPIPYAEAPQDWAWLQYVAEVLGISNVYKILLFLMVAGALILVFVLYEILVRSPYGRVLKAIREDEEAARSLGKDVFAYKVQALALGSAVAALAGSFIAWQFVYINPNTFLPIVTFYAWIIVVLGGAGNNKATVLGALFLWTFFEATRFLNLSAKLDISSTKVGALRIVLIGILLIAFMMFKPEGLLGRREEMILGE